MSKRNRIPRPRHLFPEVSALLIESRRTHRRAMSLVHRAIGQIPVWVAGSIAGVLGIMLTILLFFIDEPSVQAASSTQIEPQPTLSTSEPNLTPKPESPPAPISDSPLKVTVIGTYLAEPWDEEHVVTLKSDQPGTVEFDPRQLVDQWRVAMNRTVPESAFHSYLSDPRHLIDQWNGLKASEFVPVVEAPSAEIGLGLQVDKPLNLQGMADTPLSYEIVIRNPTQETIDEVTVRESLTELGRVTEVIPEAAVVDGELVWHLEKFSPGIERRLKVTLIPEHSGEILAMTRIIPTSQLSAAVRVHAPAPTPAEVEEVLPLQLSDPPPVTSTPGVPKLKLSYTEVKPLKQGDTLSMIFTVENVGTAPAENIELFVRLSGQFEHRYGEFVQHRIQMLPPGKSRRALLQATARDAGVANLKAMLTMQGEEKQARALNIPIQPNTLGKSRLQSSASRSNPNSINSRLATNARWVAREP